MSHPTYFGGDEEQQQAASEEGAINLACAVLEMTVGPFLVRIDHTLEDLEKDKKRRLEFVKSHPMVSLVIDSIDRDPVRFRRQIVEKIDNEFSRAVHRLSLNGLVRAVHHFYSDLSKYEPFVLMDPVMLSQRLAEDQAVIDEKNRLWQEKFTVQEIEQGLIEGRQHFNKLTGIKERRRSRLLN